MELRPVIAADGPFLAEMLVEAVNWHPCRQVPAARVLSDPESSHYIAGWPRPGDGGLVAIADGRPIGAGWWRFFSEADPGYGFVAVDVPELSIAVVAAWRGQGVGRALLRGVKQAAAPHCRRISLSVERANDAWQLYRSEGFHVIAGGPDSDTMVCELPPAEQ